MRKLLLLMFPGIILVASCSSTQRHAALACDEAAALALAPQIEAAIAAKDKAALAKLGIDLGAEAFVCGLKALAAKDAGSGSAVGGAK